ncbi:MAG: hypothetical protein HZC25_08855 [Rhodospirillales bacterium]|nr:hypothetical protein [Rhodospirillales bacterium]
MSNRIRIFDLPHMDPGDVAGLPPGELSLLLEDLDSSAAELARAETVLRTGLDLRYGERATALRRAEGRNTGTVRIEDGGFVVIADLPKKVRWDQEKLAALVADIRASGENPAEYVATEFKVSERAYGAWPSSIRTAFEPARTVAVGKPAWRIELGKEPK